MIETKSEAKFQIFRAQDANTLLDSEIMSVDFPSDVRPFVNEAVAHGLKEGDEAHVLFNLPGFSLTHAWLKKNYPLTRHTHDSDCLYVIISGALQLGTEILKKGDGFFVPANVPYIYVPVGENGVEVLEFRHAQAFNFKCLSGANFWPKAIETCKNNQEDWKNAVSPLLSDQ
ncbi:cupin domain-containing protein [Zhongshania sp.]|uniref:cupin domain-containing protein n=1 Tax=Zhongshania sp. TaxID=1971902 RepID=UPI003564EFD9